MNKKLLGYAEFVRLVIEALEAAGIEYLIGGAVASWAWGEPRATQDLDIVVSIPADAIDKLSEELRIRDMLVPADIIKDNLLEERGDLPINAIHMYSGYKADLYPLRAGDELRRAALGRKVKVDLGPDLGQVFIHAPEDLIIYKLWFFSLGRQTKHLRDITAIIKTLENDLDLEYIEDWATRKGLLTLWRELIAQIQSS
jgi:hypothetical protein